MPGIAAGEFTVPGSTGNFSVTGLDLGGEEPDGVFFFGTNNGTEDSVVTGSPLGQFIGLMYRQWNSPSTIAGQATSVLSTIARASINGPIHMLQTDALAVDYSAQEVSLDVDGFTVNFTTVQSNRKVKYIAWKSSNGGGLVFDTTSGAPGIVDFGWVPSSMIGIGTRDLVGGYAGSANNGQYISLGAATYQDINTGHSTSAMNAVTQGGNQARHRLQNPDVLGGPFPMTLYETAHSGALGTVIMAFLRVERVGANPNELGFAYQGSASYASAVAVWDGISSRNDIFIPPTVVGNTVTKDASINNANLNVADAVIYISAAGQDGGPGAPPGIFGVGVATRDYQGCFRVDGPAGRLYQSSQRSWCAQVKAGGAHAGITTFNDDETYTLETEVAGSTGEGIGAFVFGDIATPVAGAFIPQIYRRRVAITV